MYWALVLYKDLKKHEKKIKNDKQIISTESTESIESTESTESIESTQFIPNSVCAKCGQNNYFCQCFIFKHFNPEKDIY